MIPLRPPRCLGGLCVHLFCSGARTTEFFIIAKGKPLAERDEVVSGSTTQHRTRCFKKTKNHHRDSETVKEIVWRARALLFFS
jgi:hypothetical protein